MRVLRGFYGEDQRLVIVKTPAMPFPPRALVEKLRYESATLKCLAGHAVPDLISVPGTHATMITLDFGGRALGLFSSAELGTLVDRVRLAVTLAQAIDHPHAKGITHRRLCPDHILVHPQTKDIRLIGFGSAHDGRAGGLSLESVGLVDQSLAYMSPELIGRLSLSGDERGDLYSLGAVMYFLFSGKAPFSGHDAMQLIHSHIALRPRSLLGLASPSPRLLSDIVAKLLEKNPDDRYQSILGVVHDLKQLLDVLEKNNVAPDFKLAVHDKKTRFRLSTKLYRRDHLMPLLTEALGRVKGGNGEVSWILGPSGIGKSRLVDSFLSHLEVADAYVGQGKFDQYSEDSKPATLCRAISKILGQILTESKESLQDWQRHLTQAIPREAQVLIDVFPDLQFIMGDQPSVPPLPESEAELRFHSILSAFVGALSRKGRPLILFLDDLQWADDASIRLVEAILGKCKDLAVFFVGSFRDNEVGPGHHLNSIHLFVEEMRLPAKWIRIEPLGPGDVCDLVSESLGSVDGGDAERDAVIAAFIFRKTLGNPFFVRQLLSSFYERDLMRIDPHSEGWVVDLEALAASSVMENVIDLLMDKIRHLDAWVVEVLQYASLLGSEFTESSLVIATAKSREDVLQVLDLASMSELILTQGMAGGRALVPFSSLKAIPGTHSFAQSPKPQRYVFAHDRIHQAMYESISEPVLPSLHLVIARRLLDAAKKDASVEDTISDELFALLGHFWRAETLLDEADEKLKVAGFCLQAVRRAKTIGAHEIALKYSEFGIRLLGAERWVKNNAMAFSLEEGRVIAAYLCGNIEAMEASFQELVKQCDSPQGLASIYEAKIKMLTERRLYAEAIEIGLDFVRRLGVKMSPEPSILQVGWQLIHTRLAWLGRDINAFRDLPLCQNTRIRAVIRVLTATIAAAYAQSRNLAVAMNTVVVRLSLKHGNDTLSPQAFSQYGIVLAGYLRHFKDGLRFGEMALELSEQPYFQESYSKTVFYFYGMVRHWSHPLSESIQPLHEAYKGLIARGNFQDAHLSLLMVSIYRYLLGCPLPQLVAEMKMHLSLAEDRHHEAAARIYQIYIQFGLNLMDQAPSRTDFRGPIIDSRDLLAQLVREKDHTSLCALVSMEAFATYLLGDAPRASHFFRAVRPFIGSIAGTAWEIGFVFMNALAAIGTYDVSTRETKRQLMRMIAEDLKLLQVTAKSNPQTHGHYYALVNAELFRFQGKIKLALKEYQRAMRLCDENGYINIAGLAHELYAKFWLDLGEYEIARNYMWRACHLYAQWGAAAKVSVLKNKYPDFFGDGSPFDQSGSSHDAQLVTSRSTPQTLDAASMIRASHALSG